MTQPNIRQVDVPHLDPSQAALMEQWRDVPIGSPVVFTGRGHVPRVRTKTIDRPEIFRHRACIRIDGPGAGGRWGLGGRTPLDLVTLDRGDWLQTNSGVKFFPTCPLPGDILIEDIAHGLSHVCRFGGHCREHYSVAQHSVIVASVLPDEIKLTGLLHDASEAYLGDMVRPLKFQMPEYRRAEQHIERVIADKFGLVYPWPDEVKRADDAALMTERRDLLSHQYAWSIRAEPLPERIVPVTPAEAREMFLRAFETYAGVTCTA